MNRAIQRQGATLIYIYMGAVVLQKLFWYFSKILKAKNRRKFKLLS